MLLRNATLADGRVRDVEIDGETIAAVGEDLSAEGEVLDVAGKLVLPGMVDGHVHFREPGFSHKETWATGSRSAAAGGVTTVLDQPNTDPPTVDGRSFDQKVQLAAPSAVDFGVNAGVTPAWEPDELRDRPVAALGEVFLADSTGEMGVTLERYADALEWAAAAGVPVTVHAEDADRFDENVRDRTDAEAWSDYRPPAAETVAVEQACAAARRLDTTIHVAHVSTPEGADRAAEAGMTCEVTPHHLLLSRDDLADLGTLGRMNPPLREESLRAALFERVVDGTVDAIATDHAPHTRAEKDAGIWEAPSGVPGVETALPLLLEEARKGTIDYERVRDLTAANPAEIFELPEKGRIEPGRDADLVVVDPEASEPIRGDELHAKCGWTPFEGRQAVFPELTMVRGTTVYHDGDFAESVGENVRA